MRLSYARAWVNTFLWITLIFWPTGVFAQKTISGDATIRKKIGSDEVIITTTSRVAGAIHSVRFRGTEYIDSFDHGRQLQSASNLDGAKKFIPEVFNPTEAGSESDGNGPTSTSKLLKIQFGDGELKTSSQMAFWLRPGQKSLGNPAYNTMVLSNHLLHKEVRIGFEKLERLLDYHVTFTVPAGESHTFAQFEALTGYMPWNFQRFFRWDPEGKKLIPLEKVQGEQPYPVALATEDGNHAMGVFYPGKMKNSWSGPGYGRFYFPTEKVVKWNCVFRLREKEGVHPGDYSFRMFVPFGTIAEVEETLRILVDRFGK